MKTESFTIAGSAEILKLVERAGNKAGVARGQAFEDFLTFLRCELAGKTMEAEYLATVGKGYAKGNTGERGIDVMVEAGARLIALMVETEQDVLGDIFQGGITYGEGGQYFTPESIVALMSSLTIAEDTSPEVKSVCDPAAGSGRFLLAVGKEHPHWEFTAQDVDHRCAQMSAINMGLHGLRGYAVWQNTLTLEVHRVYQIGLFFNEAARGVIRELPIERSPFNYAATNTTPRKRSIETRPATEASQGQQMDLF